MGGDLRDSEADDYVVVSLNIVIRECERGN